MSTRLKQCAVTEFLSAENVKPAEIHRRLQAVYGENTVNLRTELSWLPNLVLYSLVLYSTADDGQSL